MCGCYTEEAQPARRLNQFGKVRICGRAGATPFLESIRPDLGGSCPAGYHPCSKKTSPESTICYEKSQNFNKTCPITDVKFVDQA